MSQLGDKVHAALREETSQCHGDRGLLLVAHRLLSAVDLCDMPDNHALSCASLHVPPGWTGVVLKVPPARLVFVRSSVAEGRTDDTIVDRSRDDYLKVWPTAAFFVVDHLYSGDVTPLVNGPSDADPAAVAAWWRHWTVRGTSWMATRAVPGPGGHLFGADALPSAPPAYPWPSPTRITKAARTLRRWVESQDIWYPSHDPRPFPTDDPEALVAASFAWALRAAMAFADFPHDVSAVLTEADLSVEYDFVPVDVALRAAVDHSSYRAAVEAAWALGDPEHTSSTLTRFACGLADTAGANNELPPRSITREWAPDVYDVDALDSYLCYKVYDEL